MELRVAHFAELVSEVQVYFKITPRLTQNMEYEEELGRSHLIITFYLKMISRKAT